MTTRVWLGALVLLVALVDSLSATDPVQVILRDRVNVERRQVTVGEVVEFRGGNPQLRDTIGRLDLAEMPPENRLTISRQQLDFRLQLANLPASLFRVSGAPVVHVRLVQRQVSPEEVANAAREALLASLPWKANQLQIELVQPVATNLPAYAEGETVNIKAEPHSASRAPGRMQVNVRIFVQSEQRLALSVYFNVRLCQQVPVCLRRIEAGETLDAARVYFDPRPVDGLARQPVSCDEVLGRKAKRTLMPGQVIHTGDLETTSAAQELLIRTNDGVRMLVEVGGLKVLASGQALQDGRKGQLIRVQNTESKKVVLGRVLEASLVKVE